MELLNAKPREIRSFLSGRLASGRTQELQSEKSLAVLSPADASVKDLRKAGFRSRTFQGFQLRPERADVLVIDEASMLSVPQMLWLVKHARENNSRVLLVGDSAQHRPVERGDALRILEQSGSVRYTELLQTQRQKVPALKAAIEDLKAGRLQAGWEKLENHGVIKEITDSNALRERAVEQHLKALRAGKTALMICPRHEQARKVAAVVRERLKATSGNSSRDGNGALRSLSSNDARLSLTVIGNPLAEVNISGSVRILHFFPSALTLGLTKWICRA